VKNQQAYLQLVGDALIPLFGALFFGWGLYFILIYYFLDLTAQEVIIQLKSRKINEFSGKKSALLGNYTALSILLLLIGIGLIHVAVYFIHPTIQFQQEWIEFMTYEELGIPQGVLLLPLIAFAAYQQYRMTFLMPAKFRSIRLEDVWRAHHQSQLLVLAAAGISMGLAHVFVLPDLVYVLAIVVLRAAYQYWQIRK
jgi:hypothetical protein